MDNLRTIKAGDLKVGDTLPGALENRSIIDVVKTRHSVVVQTKSESAFPIYSYSEGSYKTFRKTDDVEVIDCLALRLENAAKARYAMNNA